MADCDASSRLPRRTGSDWARRSRPSRRFRGQAQRDAGKLDECFARDSRDFWVETLRNADIVAAPINTLLEAAQDPDVLANGYISEIEYPEHGKTAKVHGTPWKFSETPAQIGIAPKLGEHNTELLGQLGYSDKDIEALTADGVI